MSVIRVKVAANRKDAETRFPACSETNSRAAMIDHGGYFRNPPTWCNERRMHKV